jgi:plasmid stability protein
LASLLIRNVDPALHERLKLRARANRRSMEEEARETLRQAIANAEGGAGRESLYAIARGIFGAGRGVVLDVPPRGGLPERPPPDFGSADEAL